MRVMTSATLLSSTHDYLGGHALTLAPSLNPIAVVTQCAYTGVAPRPPLSTFLKLGLAGIWDTLRQGIGLAPFYIQAASEPGSVGVLVGHETVKGMQALCRDSR